MALIYHITTEVGWQAAQTAGEVRSESLTREGFIHCSRHSQLLDVANRFFAGAEGICVLAIDEARVAAWLVNEGPVVVDDPFDQEIFPHVYAPIPISAVVAVAPLVRNAGGAFVWPNELRRD